MGLAVDIANASIAIVVLHGIKIVIAPRSAGAKIYYRYLLRQKNVYL